MSFPDFAYYKSTQTVLAFVTFSVEFILMFLIADLILNLFKEQATTKQKALFAVLAGTLLQAGWSYALYFLNNTIPFTQTQYMLITTPNPITAIIFYLLAIKIFKLSPTRSIKTMSYVYLCWGLIKNANKILGAFIFIQDYQNWNYLTDIIKQGAALILYLSVFIAVRYLLKYKKIYPAQWEDTKFFHQKKEYFLYFLKAAVVYAVSVAVPICMNFSRVSSVLAFILNVLFFVCICFYDTSSYHRQVIENNNIHISNLFNGLEAFREIKHDFYNILQTYTGYLEIEELEALKKYHNSLVEMTTFAGESMELSQRAHENPAFVALLKNKTEYAENMKVKMHYSLQCNLSDFYISNIDMCRMLGCLLDNAIESAADSAEKKIHISAESKTNASKLLIITNSTSSFVDIDDIFRHGMTGKEGHSGIGLTTVRKIIEKYGNCTFRMKCHSNEVSAYLEVRKS